MWEQISKIADGAFSTIKVAFGISNTGQTNRTQLTTDSQKYANDSNYAVIQLEQQGKTIRMIVFGSIIALVTIVIVRFKK